MYTRDTPGANRHHCKAATVASHVALSHAIALIHLVKWVEKRGHYIPREGPKVLIEKKFEWLRVSKVKAQVGGKTACSSYNLMNFDQVSLGIMSSYQILFHLEQTTGCRRLRPPTN